MRQAHFKVLSGGLFAAPEDIVAEFCDRGFPELIHCFWPILVVNRKARTSVRVRVCVSVRVSVRVRVGVRVRVRVRIRGRG